MPALSVRAPAKLNIRLKVKGRREDGYHELDSIMVPVSLCDALELETGNSGVNLNCEGIPLSAGKDNLVRQAAEIFFKAACISPAISIELTKNIPVSAGLGGGSSDAAFTLKALNQMYSNPLTCGELEKLALTLGADVPFFLKGRPCIAGGIGEKLEPIEQWPVLWYVIASPDISVSTSWVYSAFSTTDGNVQGEGARGKFGLTQKDCSDIIFAFKNGKISVRELLSNDLEQVTAFQYPVIETIKNAFMRAGAKGALMSGSGPSVFGVFGSREESLEAKSILETCNFGRIFAVGGVRSDSCWGVVKR